MLKMQIVMYDDNDGDDINGNAFDDDFDVFQTAPDKSMFFHAQEYCWEQGNLVEQKLGLIQSHQVDTSLKLTHQRSRRR